MALSQRSPAPSSATGPRICQLGGDGPDNTLPIGGSQQFRPFRLRTVNDEAGRFVCLQRVGVE
jgi:hypothetical protein